MKRRECEFYLHIYKKRENDSAYVITDDNQSPFAFVVVPLLLNDLCEAQTQASPCPEVNLQSHVNVYLCTLVAV